MLVSMVTQKGQTTIPQSIRSDYGFAPGSMVQFVEDRGEVRLKPLPTLESFHGILKGKRMPTVAELEDIFADEAFSRYQKTKKR